MKIFPNTLKGVLLHIALIIIVFIGALLLFFNSYLPAYTNHGETITVPNLEGLNMDDIEEFLVKRNLRYEVNDSTYTEKFPPLTIIKQYPKAGSRVKEDRKIFISVNRINPPTVPVPELVDRSLRNAEAVLESNELKRGRIQYKPSPFLNLVLEMRIDGKKIASGERIDKGSTVDLIVGDGYAKSTFDAPNVLGYDMDDARFFILGSNLELGLITVEGDTTGKTSIIYQQEPKAGSKVRIGDAIDLWIVPKSDTVNVTEKERRASLNN